MDRVMTQLGKWIMVVLAFVLVAGAVAWAQETGGGDPATVTGLPQLTSVAAVVAAAIALTAMLKPSLAAIPALSKVPVWAYVVGLSLALTIVANRVLHTLDGSLLVLIIQAVLTAASASGIREWFHSGIGKPVEASVKSGQ